jgi:triacylglycerol lipase
MNHTTLNNTSKEYWDFSWEELGTHDVPSAINYILNVTGHERLSYFGHSQGTTQMLAGASMMPEFYNSKVNSAFLLAPAASMIHQTQKFFALSNVPDLVNILLWVAEETGHYQLGTWSKTHSEKRMKECRLFNHKLCDLYIDFSMGTDAKDIDIQDRLDMALSNIPAGQGYKSPLHYGQLIDHKTQVFQRFDHGTEENMKKYGQATPPDYDLKSIRVPIALIAGTYDKLADPEDVKWLSE